MMLLELASVERRDQIFPTEGTISKEIEELLGNLDSLWQKFYSFVEEFPDPTYTDYVVVSD